MKLTKFKNYGLFGSLKILISYLYTKVFYPESRLIRLPIDLRNKSMIDFGENLTTGCGCRIEALKINQPMRKIVLKFGKNIQINDYVHIAAASSITIGNNVLIASKVFISDICHGSYSGSHFDSPQSIPKDRVLFTESVIIEDNVWLGENVCVLPGVKIGYGSVVGAGAVVTKDVPANSIAVGNPARVIKRYNTESLVWEKVI